MHHFFLIFSAVLLAVWPSFGSACTGIKLIAKDGSAVHGRTLEFGIKVDTSVVVIPENYSMIGTTTKGKGLEYKTKYAAVGMICFDKLAIMDGMNEKGLSIGTFYFPGYARYTSTTDANQSKSLSPIEFPSWILTQCATLDEVKEGLKDVYISPVVVSAWGDTPPPFHYIVYDKNGDALVIEPINGKLVIHPNPIGVFTNSPTLIWHFTNLRNYINLTPNNVPPLKALGMTFSPFGQGSGMVGLPGDFTPPSRFVRAAIFSITAIPSKDAQEATFQAFHILNQFDIPVGIAREVKDGVIHSDYTQATVVRDPNSLKYFFRTYDDQTIKLVDLKAFDLKAKDVKKSNTEGRQSYVDISKELK